MEAQSQNVHSFVLDSLKPVAKTNFKFPLYNQVPSKNNGSNNQPASSS